MDIPTCAKCNIDIESTVVEACEKAYHLECFLCTSCGNPLSTRRYKQRDGNPYCSLSCAGPPKEAPRDCAKCGKEVTGSAMKAFEPEQVFHPKCFQCCKCGCCVAVVTYYARDTDLFCSLCYKKELDIAFA